MSRFFFDQMRGAVLRGSAQVVVKLLDRHPDLVNQINQIRFENTDWTLLHHAAQSASKDIVRVLIERGANVDLLSSMQDTPLNFACKGGHVDIAVMLMDAGADPHIPNVDGCSPVMTCVQKGRLKILEVMLDRGVRLSDVPPWNNGDTLTHMAARYGQYGMLQFLKRVGVDVVSERTSATGRCRPIDLAVENNHAHVVRLFLELGISPNSTLRTAPIRSPKLPLKSIPLLHGAVVHGHQDVVETLLDGGANIDKKGDDGRTALHYSITHRHSDDITMMLLRRGARIDVEDGGGYKPIHLAVQLGKEVAISELFRLGEDPFGRMPKKKVGNSPGGETYDKILERRPDCLAILQAFRNVRMIDGVIASVSPDGIAHDDRALRVAKMPGTAQTGP
jgi:ankyrin repeat protein